MSEASTVQIDPYADESVADLIEWLTLGDKEIWQDASRSIYSRYYEWLFRRLYKPLRNTGYLEDITIKTIRKALRNISKFEKIENEDLDDTKARFEGWLLKIAKHLNYDFLRKKRCEPFETRETEFWEKVKVDAKNSMSPAPPFQEAQAAEEALNELSERDQFIIRTWLEHCPDCDNPQSKLPRKVLQELCDTLGTTKQYTRTLKMRALARLKKNLQKKGLYT